VEFVRGKFKIHFLLSQVSEGYAALCRRHHVACELRVERVCSVAIL